MKRCFVLALAVACAHRSQATAEVHETAERVEERDAELRATQVEQVHETKTEAPVHEVIVTTVDLPAAPGQRPRRLRRVRTIDRGPTVVQIAAVRQNEAIALQTASAKESVKVGAKAAESSEPESSAAWWLWPLAVLAGIVLVACIYFGVRR